MLRMAAVAGIVSEDAIRNRSTGATLSPTWEKQVLSAEGFRRVGRRSEYAI